MSSKLPFTDTIHCVPSKVKDADGKRYPGGMLAGVLEDIRLRLFHGFPVPILHMPGGWIDNYNVRVGNAYNWGYGINDKKADIDPATRPDFCFDCRRIKERFSKDSFGTHCYFVEGPTTRKFPIFEGVLIDRDYDREFARAHRKDERDWPTDAEIEQVGRDCFETVLGDDGLVIFFDHKDLGLGKGFVQLWKVTVYASGRRQYPRVYTVWCKEFDRSAVYPAPGRQRGKS